MNKKLLLTALFVVMFGVGVGVAETIITSGLMTTVGAKTYRFNVTKQAEHSRYDVLFNLNKFEKSASDIEKDAYRLRIDDMPVISQPGLPALPYKTICLALPCEMNDISINVVDTAWLEYDCKLEPAQAPRTDNDDTAPALTAIAAYRGYEPAECFAVTDMQVYRGRPIYTIALMPVKYDYERHKIKVLTRFNASITYVNPSGKDLSGRSEQFNLTTANMLRPLDFDSVNQEPERPEAFASKNVTEDYLIVTTPQFENQARRFADWKQTLGYRTHIETNANWTYVGVDNIVKQYYADCDNLNNLLIIGTVNDVPSLSYADLPDSTYNYAQYRSSSTCTDMFYSCMDGPNDNFSDILYGRIVCIDTLQAATFIDKLIKYECCPPSDPEYYSNGFVAGNFERKEDAVRPEGDTEKGAFIRTTERIRNALLTQNKDIERIYAANSDVNPMFWTNDSRYWPLNAYHSHDTVPSDLRRPSFLWDGNNNDVVTALNQGVSLGIYNGHGSEISWAGNGFSTYDFAHLTNQWHQPLILSMACNTGSITNVNNFASQLTRGRCGALAVIASTSLSYYGYNDALALGMIDAIWPTSGLRRPVDNDSSTRSPKFRLGEILWQGQLRCAQTLGNPNWTNSVFHFYPKYLQYQRMVYLCHGDPSMIYHESIPHALTNVSFSHTNASISVNCDAISGATPVFVSFDDKKGGRTERYEYSFTPPVFENPSDSTITICIYGPGRATQIYKSVSGIVVEEPGLPRICNITYTQASQTLNVLFISPNETNINLHIVDIYGNIINCPIINNGIIGNISGHQQVSYDLSNVNNGIYIVLLEAAGSIADYHKFIKQ